VIKVGEGDQVMGFGLGRKGDQETVIAECDTGKPIPVGPGLYQVTSRGGRGHVLRRKARVVRVSTPEPPPPPSLLN
jgi:hypothetical protein